MPEKIILKYIFDKENFVKCHIMLLDISGLKYEIEKMDENMTDFYLLTGSSSGMLLNWNGHEAYHPVACAKLIGREAGLFGDISPDQEAEMDEIVHLTLHFFNLEVSRELHLKMNFIHYLCVVSKVGRGLTSEGKHLLAILAWPTYTVHIKGMLTWANSIHVFKGY